MLGEPPLRAPVAVLTVHCVVEMVAVKLPLLCAKAADEPKKANATMARPASTNLLIVELSVIIIVSMVVPPPLR